MLRRIFDQVMYWLNMLMKFGGFSNIAKTWRESDAKDRGILLLVFSPMLLCLAGLALSVIYFVLFVLPMFVFRIAACGILASLAGWGGRRAMKYFTGREISEGSEDVIDAEFWTTNASSR